jgi:ribosomal protein L22
MTDEPERKEDAPVEDAAASSAPEASASEAAAPSPVESAGDEAPEPVDAGADDGSADEIEATPEDVEAEEATEVVLEADDEAEGEPEPEAEAVVEEKPRRTRRRGAARAEEKAEPEKPAPARRRRRERPAGPAPVVRAQAKYVRSSARKARLVCDHIRGKTVLEARAILAHTPRAVARDWSKLLESAVANAEHNHSLDGEDLYIKAVHADEGPTIKRFRPRAMGRATKIRKRTTHLTILLTPQREAGGRTSSSRRGAGRPAED